MDDLAQQLKSVVRGEVSVDDAALATYSKDASLFSVRPRAVVFPLNVADVKALVKFVVSARERGETISLTGRAAGTDMSGGPLTESVVVSFTQHFNVIGAVQDGYVDVEPGVFYRDFEQATLAKDWLMPSYPASREICTVGGMVSNNSGGEKSLRYGKTADYVDELHMVWRDGEEHRIRSLSYDELEVKKREAGLEGEVYRSIHDIVTKNRDLLAKAKPKVSKNSAGYALWDVLDEQKKQFHLQRLLVGSQGTLGLVTNIRFRLVHPETHRRMLVISMRSLNILPEVVHRVLAFGPETFESYDNHTFRVALKFLPELLQRALHHHLIKLGFHLIPAAWQTLTGGIPKLVLLAEFTGPDMDTALQKALAAKESLKGMPVTIRLTTSQEESDAFLSIRRESFNLLRQHVHGMRTAPFIDDVAVPPDTLPQFLPALSAILDKSKMIYTVAGHVGDGNFHIIPLVKIGDPNLKNIIPKVGDEVYDLVLKYGGTIDGEHNDGLIRTPYLERQFGSEVCKLFAKAKHVFDPNDIFNPGKKVGGSLDYALNHLS